MPGQILTLGAEHQLDEINDTAPLQAQTTGFAQLQSSFGTGFKAPTLNALFESFPQFDFFANSSLKPETSLGYDVGFDQALFDKRVRFGATYFHSAIRDLITVNETVTSYENVGIATTEGASRAICPTNPSRR
jgi:outer membrane cobalamin receptor